MIEDIAVPCEKTSLLAVGLTVAAQPGEILAADQRLRQRRDPLDAGVNDRDGDAVAAVAGGPQAGTPHWSHQYSG
jgi:hypothetical protein